MSTVTQVLLGGRHALSAGDTRRSDIDSNVECESDLKKNRLLRLFVKSEKQFCSQKLLLWYSRALVDLQDTHVDGVCSSLAGARKETSFLKEVLQKNFPHRELNPGPPGWKPGILTTRPYGTRTFVSTHVIDSKDLIYFQDVFPLFQSIQACPRMPASGCSLSLIFLLAFSYADVT